MISSIHPSSGKTAYRHPWLLLILLNCSVASTASAQIHVPRTEPVRPSEVIESIWKAEPEWLAMFADLMGGGQVSAQDGWYRLSKPLTRFEWDDVRKKFDSNGDGTIARDELKVPDQDFVRLDRDNDRKLTQQDFAFPVNELARARSKVIMSFADLDRDGKLNGNEFGRALFLANRDNLTRHMYFADSNEEVEKYFRESSSQGMPYLSLADLQDIVDRNAIRYGLPFPPNPDAEFYAAPRETLLLAFARRDLGSYLSGPALNAPAPEFALKKPGGGDPVTLSQLRSGGKPVVLIFGCLTSPPFRAEAGNLLKLHHRYKDRVEFVFIYVRDSNPVDGWRLKENDDARVKVTQPTTYESRVALAGFTVKKLALPMTTLVDDMDDRVTSLYSGAPSRLYLIDGEGKIAYKGARGPFGFKPRELEHSLLMLLASEPASAAGKSASR